MSQEDPPSPHLAAAGRAAEPGLRVRRTRGSRWVLVRERRHLPAVWQRADESIYAWLSTQRSTVLDATLPRLSRAANRSGLWALIAGGLALFGGRKGRSAAAHGMRTLAITSALVNGPIKLLANRHRPGGDLIPAARRLARVPTSSSFPSGHTASAAAFATSVGMEVPALAAPLGALATGVGVSRVYTGVHYPLDVAAGAALGVLAAVMVRRSGNRAAVPVPAAELPSKRHLPLSSGRGLIVVVNSSAGSALTRDPEKLLRDAFPEATFVVPEDDPVQAVRAACGDGTVALAAAGGDGSVNAVATVALERGLPLAVLPTGTLNHFARDLGIDDVPAAIEAMEAGRVVEVDVGLIAGQPFLNTASFAAYAKLVDEREALEAKIGKWPAALLGLWRIVGNPPTGVKIDGRPMRLWGIFIGNGKHVRGLVPSRRLSIGDGRFDIRVLRADRRYPRLHALVVAGPRRLVRSSAFEGWITERVEVESLEGPMRLARDGETFDGPERFVIEKSPRRLEVFVP